MLRSARHLRQTVGCGMTRLLVHSLYCRLSSVSLCCTHGLCLPPVASLNKFNAPCPQPGPRPPSSHLCTPSSRCWQANHKPDQQQHTADQQQHTTGGRTGGRQPGRCMVQPWTWMGQGSARDAGDDSLRVLEAWRVGHRAASVVDPPAVLDVKLGALFVEAAAAAAAPEVRHVLQAGPLRVRHLLERRHVRARTPAAAYSRRGRSSQAFKEADAPQASLQSHAAGNRRHAHAEADGVLRHLHRLAVWLDDRREREGCAAACGLEHHHRAA
jgi:hypothetical protein